jgi:hypothetical protein
MPPDLISEGVAFFPGNTAKNKYIRKNAAKSSRIVKITLHSFNKIKMREWVHAITLKKLKNFF